MPKTQVGIIGAGPAGLVLAHLLAQQGIESVVIEKHSRDYIEHRVRAGLLEHRTVELLDRHGLGERMLREGAVHRGTEFRTNGERYRLPYSDLYGGRRMLVYPQQELVADLVRLRLDAGAPIVFEAADVMPLDIEGPQPRIRYTVDGQAEELDCDIIAGCDGFHGVSRDAVPPGALNFYDQHLPFGWLGILAAVGPSTSEIIYALHDRGFAGHMLRTDTVSRFYLQCAPEDDPNDWADDVIWDELQRRLATPGWTLSEGPIIEKTVAELRSFVTEPMQYGRLFLAGDAAHIAPPTGAKGMNLAIADVEVLAGALGDWYLTGDDVGLQSYSDTCLRRVWRVQEFSTWMSWMLHRPPDDMPGAAFHRKMQEARLEYVCTSTAAGTSFAENYVGIEWPAIEAGKE